MHTTTIDIDGMTCDHCVRHVTEALEALDGVTQVSIDLHPGEVSPVTVSSTEVLAASAVHAAVDDAGYTAIAIR